MAFELLLRISRSTISKPKSKYFSILIVKIGDMW